METPSFRPLANRKALWGMTIQSGEEIISNQRRMMGDLLRLFLANKTPITLWGPVGARKTRSIEALRNDRDENGTPYQVITIQPSTEDPTVIHGLMYTSREEDESGKSHTVMRRSIPDVAKQIKEYWDEYNGLTILFMDEMTTCMPAQQHALLGILTHGKYGKDSISDYISIVMAANPEGTVANVNDLGEQVLNRGGHIPWYGDLDLFLEEWGNGFGTPELSPDNTVKWYIENWTKQDPEKAFRNPEKWNKENLVPYDLMEHTERIATEMAGMLTLINEVFQESPDEIRHRYIIETCRALAGNEWANHMAVVTEMEKEMLSASYVLRVVRDDHLSWDATHEELTDLVGKKLSVSPSGVRLRQDQRIFLMNELVEMCKYTSSTPFNSDAYLASWAFVMSLGNADSGDLAGLHIQLAELLKIGQSAVRDQILDKSRGVPRFVTQDVRNFLKNSLR